MVGEVGEAQVAWCVGLPERKGLCPEGGSGACVAH